MTALTKKRRVFRGIGHALTDSRAEQSSDKITRRTSFASLPSFSRLSLRGSVFRSPSSSGSSFADPLVGTVT